MATRPTKRSGSTQYSNLTGQAILGTEMDADLNPLWQSMGVWTVDTNRWALSLNQPGVSGIEFGMDPSLPQRGRVAAWKTGVQICYNYNSWKGPGQPMWDNPAEPCLDLELGTWIGEPGSGTGYPGVDMMFSLSYLPPGDTVGAWIDMCDIVMWNAAAGNVCELALSCEPPYQIVRTRVANYFTDGELSVNWNHYWLPDDPTRPSWSLDMEIDPTNYNLTFSTRGANDPPNGTTPFVFMPMGDLKITGANAWKASGTTWANASDPRLKTDIAPYTAGLAEIIQVEPKTYRLKSNPDLLCHGFDAEAVKPVLPECVGSMKIDGEDYLTFDMNPMLVAMVNAVKELSTRVTALEK